MFADVRHFNSTYTGTNCFLIIYFVMKYLGNASSFVLKRQLKKKNTSYVILRHLLVKTIYRQKNRLSNMKDTYFESPFPRCSNCKEGGCSLQDARHCLYISVISKYIFFIVLRHTAPPPKENNL